jgi:hypothetical protein
MKRALKKVLKHLEKEGLNDYPMLYGLCSFLNLCYNQDVITSVELENLQKYFSLNLPKKRYNVRGGTKKVDLLTGLYYCWKPGSTIGRIKWLKKQIALQK